MAATTIITITITALFITTWKIYTVTVILEIMDTVTKLATVMIMEKDTDMGMGMDTGMDMDMDMEMVTVTITVMAMATVMITHTTPTKSSLPAKSPKTTNSAPGSS